ncbi:MAG: hypothetical protein ABEJ81_08325 [Haloferacaceae archaeon]
MRPPVTRRRLLALAGPTLTVGGCLGSSAGDDATTDEQTTAGTTIDETPRRTTTPPDGPVRRAPGERYETADGWSLTVDPVGVQQGVLRFGVHIDPVWESGSQFLVADVAVDGDGAPDPTDLNIFVRTDTLDRSDRQYVHGETNADGRRQRFGYPVPTDPSPSRAAVVWSPDDGPAVRWSLGSDLVEALGAAPDFAVESFSVPETAVPDDEFEATLSVGNDGDRDGTFLAEVGNALISDQPEVTLDVPVGETVTGHPPVEAHFGDGDELPVVLRWSDGTERRTVRRA